MKTLILICLLTLVLPLHAVAGSTVGCNDDFVELSGAELVITVAPTGADDTTNMQCALDAAIDLGVPIVRLGGATYSISHIRAVGFKGSLDGKTKAETIVNIMDSSVDCAALSAAGLESAAIVFSEGTPKLRFMTIHAQTPCNNGARIASVVHFTGESALADNCDNDVIFGEIDRINIHGFLDQNKLGPATGISVSSEGRSLGGCKDTLLGTFKLNRSFVQDFNVGLLLSMRAGAEVDVNFNEFEFTGDAGVLVINSNQNTTIINNIFFSSPSFSDSNKTIGVKVVSDSETAPTFTRVVISKNDFLYFVGLDGVVRSVVLEAQSSLRTTINAIVDHNNFDSVGENLLAVVGRNITNAHVFANTFVGGSLGNNSRAIFVGGTAAIGGWAIMANNLDGFNVPVGQEITLAQNTSGCVIGPDQKADVFDFGTGNHVLNGSIGFP